MSTPRPKMLQDRRAGRDPFERATKWGLEIVFQQPNLEGLLLRLHEGHEQRSIRPEVAAREARKQWPEYEKASLTAARMKRRFSLQDLQRAARHDEHLRRLLKSLGL